MIYQISNQLNPRHDAETTLEDAMERLLQQRNNDSDEHRDGGSKVQHRPAGEENSKREGKGSRGD